MAEGHRDRLGRRAAARAVGAVLRRPGLWATAAVQAGRAVRPRWWRRAPFLPVPDRAYLRYRLQTQYGAAGDVEPGDLVAYLEWCRAMAREQRGR